VQCFWGADVLLWGFDMPELCVMYFMTHFFCSSEMWHIYHLLLPSTKALGSWFEA
jgi:hypothetical protein